MTRILIVNADDFGRSDGVNRGVIQAHEKGIVTSASLMVRYAASADAAEYGRDRPRLSLGLHVDLGEWLYQDGTWTALYELEDFEDEVERQLDAFRSLVHRDPTHLDSHQHLHREKPVRSIMLGMARRLGVPLRSFSPWVRYCGSFYGQTGTGEPLHGAISAEALVTIFRELPEGVTELGCHPGYADDLRSHYAAERTREVEALCHPQLKSTLAAEEIELRSFHDAWQR
jgi:chitin disaccharide deacetylase